MKMTSIVNLKRKDLLSLPLKKDSNIKEYENIIVVPTNKKHDSGWRLMALIGVEKTDNGYIPTEIIGYCDDINFLINVIVMNLLDMICFYLIVLECGAIIMFLQ